MNARVALRTIPATAARIALLGTGTVGAAVMLRLARLQRDASLPALALVYAGNSRGHVHAREGLCPEAGLRTLAAWRPAERKCAQGPGDHAEWLDAWAEPSTQAGTRIVIDATGSEALATRHAHWLRRGVHVVAAGKRGRGESLQRWQEIHAACELGSTQYGDSATVGAGLPLLRTLAELRAGGDRIHALAGVLSGSMAWLFDRYDGLRPFSGFVRQARDAGYTEPDPREDLSGDDVRRKLLILARAAGVMLGVQDVHVDPLLPDALATAGAHRVDDALASLDAPMRARFAESYKRGERLRFIARLQQVDARWQARVGLESLKPDDPLCTGGGTDNRVALWSDRYRERPVVIQGPGAGAGVTAAAVLDDVLRIARVARAV